MDLQLLADRGYSRFTRIHNYHPVHLQLQKHKQPPCLGVLPWLMFGLDWLSLMTLTLFLREKAEDSPTIDRMEECASQFIHSITNDLSTRSSHATRDSKLSHITLTARSSFMARVVSQESCLATVTS